MTRRLPPTLVAGSALVGLVILAALLSAVWTPADPTHVEVTLKLKAPAPGGFLLVATWAAHTSDLPHPPGRAVEGWITRPKPRATGEAFPHIRSARVDRLAARCSPRGGEHGLCGRKQRGCLKQCATRRTRHQLHRRNRGSPSGQRTLGSADVACRHPYRVIIQREERSVSPRPWTGG